MIKEKLKAFRNEYYQWRYWRSIIRTIKRQRGNKPQQFNHINQLYQDKPGIAFSFDDSFRIDQWYKYGKDLFGFYDVKVTFNINAYHHFEGKRVHNQDEIDMLIELQAHGHEIAHHGFKHKNAAQYSSEYGLERWIEDEIVPLIKWMDLQSHTKTKEKFKTPVSLALPYTEINEEDLKAIIPKYFKLVRGGMFENNLTPFNCTGFAPSICIDSVYLTNVRYVKKIMKIAKKVGSNVIFMCHSILPENINWKDFGWETDTTGVGWWRISPTLLKKIINGAKEIGMEFYTTAEIAGIATFIDPNFENAVREIINSSDKWIHISQLSEIRELDLRDMNISNLDGIQYFINLEKINLSNNDITDFRLLSKLPKLKDLLIDDNKVLKEFVS